MSIERQLKESGLNGNLNKLIHLVGLVQPEEVHFIRDYIQNGRLSAKKTYQVELFDLIRSGDIQTSTQLLGFYKDLTASHVEKTAGKLLEKLLAAIVDTTNYRRKGAKTPKGVAVYAVKDLAKQTVELNYRGALLLAFDRLNDWVNLAKEYELFPDLISALHTKYILYRLHSRQESLVEVEAEIAFYESAQKATYRAEQLFHQLTSLVVSSSKKGEHSAEILKGITELQNLYGSTSSSMVYFFLISIEIIYFSDNREFAVAHSKAEELLLFVESKPALYGKPHLPICYLYLAQTKLGIYEFAEALAYCELCKKHFSPGSWNYGETLLLEFYARFYLNQYSQALACIDQLIDGKRYPVTHYKRGERLYLKVCCLLAMGNYSEAQFELTHITRITKDKAGWNIGVRVIGLTLACIGKDWQRMDANYKVLKRDLNRIKNLVNVSERDQLIISLLQDLLHYEGNFKKVIKLRQIEIEEMGNSNSRVSWRIYGHELIPFHLWLNAISQKRPFLNNLQSELNKSDNSNVSKKELID